MQMCSVLVFALFANFYGHKNVIEGEIAKYKGAEYNERGEIAKYKGAEYNGIYSIT